MISQKYFQIDPAIHVHLKTDKVDFKKKSHHEIFIFFAFFFQSPHQEDMKNVVKCPREFIAYFNALETTCAS